MTKEEFKSLQRRPKESTLNIGLLDNKKPRTLLLGYNSDRKSVHAYIEEEKLCVIVYFDSDSKIDNYWSGEVSHDFLPGLKAGVSHLGR